MPGERPGRWGSMRELFPVTCFFGTRPEAIKMAPVVRAIEAHPRLRARVVSTGQHREMLAQVVELFGLDLDAELDVMRPGQGLAGLTARLLEGLDAELDAHPPALALVQGDTTTVLSAALACFYRRVPIGHVEAGLRSGDLQQPFPEEANRLLATRLATLHFPPTSVSEANLLREGVAAERITVTGNTVIDALHAEVARQEKPGVTESLDAALANFLPTAALARPYVLITGHRRENFGDGFEHICAAIAALAQRFADTGFVYPVHLNPAVQEPVNRLLARQPNVYLLPPQPYAPFVRLMRGARLLLTDSGGVQEEAPGLGKPVLVMRATTERPEGVDAGTVKLVGTDRGRIVAEVTALLTDEKAHAAMAKAVNPYGDGRAAGRIADAVAAFLQAA